ncbi:MAG: zinc ABC transporter substrate-binding protein, partial [Chloroflexi bacterium]|nr:zinc ABC transporter substrate-binding protein [Chloroflexota bacterium]
MKARWLLASGAVALAALLAACSGGGPAGTGEEKLKVVTSLGIFADFVRQVGGDRVDVTSVIPSGADPETFEPSPRDIRDVTEADIV